MLAGHKNAVLELHWTSDGERLLSASPDKSVRCWDAATGEQACLLASQRLLAAPSLPWRSQPLLQHQW